ncbi:MAG: AI-2E family transporter [Pseudomonadota bacterium]|nr:AI-2E family transporter [Pseudomonadota bacterium]
MSHTGPTALPPTRDPSPDSQPAAAPQPGAARVRDPVRTIAHILRATAIVAGIAALLWALSDAVLVIFLALLFATMLRGLGKELHRLTRLNITIAVLVVFFALIALICGFGYWVGPRLANEGQQLWGQMSGQLGSIQNEMHRFGFGGITDSGGGGSPLPHMIELVANSTLGFLAAILVVVVAAVYFAVAPDTYIAGIVYLTPIWYHDRARQIVIEMGHTMQGWLLGQLIDMVIVGVLVGVGLKLLGVPLFLSLGVIAGLFTFVPYFGTIVSAIPALLVGLTLGLHGVLSVLGLFVVAHCVEGYVVAPFVQRRTVDLPPALTVLAIIVLTAFLGFLGVLIATPLIAVILVGVTRIYVEDVLGDRAAGAKLPVGAHWYWFTPPDVTSRGETAPQARNG